MPSETCPPDEEPLWPLAVGESTERVLSAHVETCSHCQAKVRDLQAEMESLRAVASNSQEIGDVGHDPTLDLRTDAIKPAGATARAPFAIGRYRVLCVLGEGGQGVVYRALHPNLPRDVIIKLSKQRTGADPANRDRLVNEAKLLSEIDHPNLARLYDLDFHENQPFLVLEYVRGVNLRQYVKHRSLAPRETAEITAKIARAVAAPHAVGIVHQDVKPDNIVINPDGEPILIDFGMACLRDAWVDDSADPGTVAGTPAFMAPEQARGDTENIGPRSDVFALGAVLYFLLAGQPPFASESLGEALDMAARCEFDRHALESSNAPRSLKIVCLKAMSSEIEDRHRSAAELGEQLERIAQPSRVWRWLAGAGAAAALLLVVLLASKNGSLPNSSASAIQPEFHFQIWQQNEENREGFVHAGELSETGSLLSGDQLQIEGKVPTGYHFVIFAFTREGKLEQLTPAEVSTAGGVDRVVYPSGATRAPLDGSPGTHALFVCGRAEQPVEFSEVEEAFRNESPWPHLPNPDSRVEIDMHGAKVGAGNRLVGDGIEIPEAPVIERATQVQQRLAEEFDYIYGVAFRFE